MLGFKFYPRLTKLALVVVIVGFLLVLGIALIVNLFNKQKPQADIHPSVDNWVPVVTKPYTSGD